MYKRYLIILFFPVIFCKAQDSTGKMLDSITLSAIAMQQTIKPLPAIQGTFVFSGKKTEQIDLSQIPADVTNKSARQLFARVPGIFVYDMDGAGNQVNIATRGLDPHRGWEFNNRKDGILTNSDMYGYPASHYSMPMESIARIEFVRGSGSLQYGAQFGGMLNYISKQGDSTRPFGLESISSTGSYNLISNYTAIGGKSGSIRYYAYNYKKSRDGYRKNEHTESAAQAAMISWQAGPNIQVRAEWARSVYRYKIPGPLNDSMFRVNPRQATRNRNYFSPDIHIPSVTVHWQAAGSTQLQLTTSAVLGKRNSILFDKAANIADTINTATGQYNNRQVDIDRFNSYTAELRMLHQYKTGMREHYFATGLQVMVNDLHRKQIGKGSTGSDYDLSLVTPGWGRDLHFKTGNMAFFAENALRLSKNFTLTIGGRLESGKTDMSGKIVYYPDNQVPLRIRHRFPLFGTGFSWNLNEKTEIYGGWSQAYRPMIFKDLIPGSLYEKTDPAIKDASGYNAELGFRGSNKFFRWDLTAFLLQYNNRFGTLAGTDNNGNLYTYRTNIGDSRSAGIELSVQADWHTGYQSYISIFSSLSLTDARYTNGMIKSGNSNVSVRNKKVESAPGIINRSGITVRIRKANLSALYSYTGSTFADPLNTVTPLPGTGAVGRVPAYGLLDFSCSYRFFKQVEAKLVVSNLANKQYFTKRPLFYPGPGIWPSDGRNATITIAIHL